MILIDRKKLLEALHEGNKDLINSLSQIQEGEKVIETVKGSFNYRVQCIGSPVTSMVIKCKGIVRFLYDMVIKIHNLKVLMSRTRYVNWMRITSENYMMHPILTPMAI